jgi:hypothetical protein
MAYAAAALANTEYVEPSTSVHKAIIYQHLYEELKRVMLLVTILVPSAMLTSINARFDCSYVYYLHFTTSTLVPIHI